MDTNNLGQTREKTRKKTAKPPMYQVVLYNDDYTTMEFVVQILQKVFHKSAAEAGSIMLNVHQKGRGIVGLFTFDIGSTKVGETRKMAKANGFPLKCTLEPAE